MQWIQYNVDSCSILVNKYNETAIIVKVHEELNVACAVLCCPSVDPIDIDIIKLLIVIVAANCNLH